LALVRPREWISGNKIESLSQEGTCRIEDPNKFATGRLDAIEVRMNHRTIYGRNSGHKLICLLVLLFRGNVLGQETPRQEARSEDLKLGLTTVKPQVQLAEGDIGDLKSSSSSQSLARVNRATKKPPQTLDHERDELAAPSVTSVHQVWASSSSGSLEELSPEIISKLGGSVPFLAAYALRPRLVGVSALPAHRTQPGNSIQPMESLTNARVLAPMDDASGNQAASSSPDESEGSIVSKLGEFNELKVETSSTSKSEHRHDRKTTLKRNNRELELTKRRVIKEADQLKKRRVKPLARPSLAESGKQRGRKSISGSRSANKGRVVGGTGSHGSQARAGRLRAKTERKGRLHPLNAVKRGRQVQEQSNGTVVAADLDENSVESEESGRGATEVDGLKGGNGRKRKHFYSAVEKSSNPSDEQDGDEQAKGNAGRDSSTVSDSGDEGSDIQRDPKRVGDEDVDEEGDTVTVMPKSDGVDDDPDLGEGGEEGGPVEEREFGERESEEQPREADKEGSEADMEKQDERDENSLDQGRGDGKAAGGGLGATIGDGTPTMRGTGATNNADEEDGRMGGNKSEKSAPEDKARDRDEGNEREESIGQTESSGKRDESSRRNKHNEDDDDDSRFGSDARGRSADKEDTERNKGTGLDAQGFGGKQEPMGFRKSVGSNADKNGEEEEPDDVDYRDELEASARKKHTGRENSSPKKHSRDEADCEDRAHDYDHDGHHDHGHHSHHDSIKWLEDAIPGQPNEDYPILSRTNLTSFNCRKQKYAGYYADVEARCQVFHICQADGRQDSFM